MNGIDLELWRSIIRKHFFKCLNGGCALVHPTEGQMRREPPVFGRKSQRGKFIFQVAGNPTQDIHLSSNPRPKYPGIFLIRKFPSAFTPDFKAFVSRRDS